MWWANSTRKKSTTRLHISWYFGGDYRKGKSKKTHRLKLGWFYMGKKKGVKTSDAVSRRWIFNQSLCNDNFESTFSTALFFFWVWPCVVLVLRSAVLAVCYQSPACLLEREEWEREDLGAVEALLSNINHWTIRVSEKKINPVPAKNSWIGNPKISKFERPSSGFSV